MLNAYPWLLPALGYAIPILAHFAVGPAVRCLWALTEADFKANKITIPPGSGPVRPNKTVSFWHGVAERAVYLACVVLDKPEGIAVWLGFKAVIRWKASETADPRHVPGAPIYMIGTAMNVAFGVLGGFLALGHVSF